ncbi:MAG: hypothetical protein RL368_420 [Pseudomonadota bacterium]|jgi:predicted RNase H-like HicB family nuclease
MLNNKRLTLRCYAKREGTHWVAVCIDLSLAAQASSPKEAITKLESMIQTYVKEALTQHKAYAEQLLSRKAPLSQRLYYYWVLLRRLGCLFDKKSNDHNYNDNSVFSEDYPINTI